MAGEQTISTSETKAEALKLQSSAYGVTIPVVDGTAAISGNLLDYIDFKSVGHTESSGGKGGGVSQENTTYTYTVTLVMGICEGRDDGVPIAVTKIWRGKKTYTGADAAAQIGATVIGGAVGQSVWSPLTTIAGGAHALAYSGLACVAAQDYDLGSSAQIENHKFEVVAGNRVTVGSSVTDDADPAAIFARWLTNQRWGVGLDSSWMGDLSMYSTYCKAAGLLLSPALTEQAKASQRVDDLCDTTNSMVVIMDEQIHVVPLGDETLTGNGVTYTPDLTPIYDLTPDQFLADPGQSPIRITRKTPADAFNSVKIEYLDRAADYNVAIATAVDQASADQYGPRVADTLQRHWVCDPAVANQVAQLKLKQFRYILNTYEFRLPWNFASLVPTNIVTITDPDEGFDRLPVRITTITEDDGGFLIEAQDFPHSVSSVSSYPLPVTDGYKHDYNVSPGSVVAPVFIEPPVELTTTGLEVWTAVSGNSPYWGGCQVWCSYDGTNYKRVGTIRGGARYGSLTAGLAAGATSGLALQLAGNGGQLLNGSVPDAINMATLCWMRGTGPTDKPEFISYETATLTGSNAYSLSGMIRGAYGSSSSAKAAGTQFARIDDNVAKSDPLQPSMIGQTIRFKFVSFNIYGGGLEDLATVAEYAYVIRGDMALLPPPNVQTFNVGTQADGTRQFTWSWGSATKPADLKGYVIRYLQGTGPYTWDQMQPFDTDDGFHTASPIESNLLLAGAYVFAIKTVDSFGVLSENALFISATLPDPRLGNAIEFTDEFNAGWPGALSGCVKDVWSGDTILRANDQATWATLPSTWDSWTRWVWDPVTSFQYVTQAVDLGTTVAVLPVASAVADGVVTFEISTSPDGSTWSGWASVAGPVVTRYIKCRFTVSIPPGSPTGPGVTPLCSLRRLTIAYIGKVTSETGNDQDITSYTGVHRIGAGHVRLPTQKVWAHISRVTVALQSVGAGWSWSLIDKDPVNGPEIKVFNGSGALADPPLIDWTIEGIST